MGSALHGLPRARRLRKRHEFVRVQSKGARVTAPSLVFLLAARTETGPTRLGVTASRKVGDAVVRNRAKRLVRAAFRLHPELVPAGVDLVVVVRRDLDALGLAGVVAEWSGVSAVLARRAAALRPALADGALGPQAPPDVGAGTRLRPTRT